MFQRAHHGHAALSNREMIASNEMNCRYVLDRICMTSSLARQLRDKDQRVRVQATCHRSLRKRSAAETMLLSCAAWN